MNGRQSPHQHPDVRKILDGITRERGLGAVQKAPILAEHLRAMVKAQEGVANRLKALRNRALLLLLWTGAFRRAELVALTVESVEACPEGMRVKVQKSKTDQKGHGKVKPIPRGSSPDLCPVAALDAWVDEAGIRTGYLFLHVDRWGHLRQRLTGHAVACIVKEFAEAAGLDPASVSGHSARAGRSRSTRSWRRRVT
jgi:hypothetical protein